MTAIDWTGPRRERFAYELVDRNDQRVRWLSGVRSCTIDWNDRAMIRTSGNLSLDVLEDTDWGSVRVRPWIVVDDWQGVVEAHPLGVFVPKVPETEWRTRAGASAYVELYDKLLVLDEDEIGAALSLPAGAIVTDVVRSLIVGAGETRIALTPSDRALSSALYFEATSKRLAVINRLLVDVLGYWGLWVDESGVFQIHPYVSPSRRAIAYTFPEGPACIYRDGFKAKTDLWDLPNQLVGYTATDGDTLPATATAYALPDWPTHPDKMGGRVIRRTLVDLDVPAAELQGYLDDRLERLSRPSESYEVAFQWVPLPINGAARFESTTAGISRRVVYPKRSMRLKAGDFVTATFQGVSDD